MKKERDRKYNLQIYNKFYNVYERTRWLKGSSTVSSPTVSSSSTHHGTIFGIRPISDCSFLPVVFVRYPGGWTRHIDLKILLNTCDSSYHHHRLSSLHYQLLISVNHILSVIMLINSIIFIIVNAYLGMCIYACMYVCVYCAACICMQWVIVPLIITLQRVNDSINLQS